MYGLSDSDLDIQQRAAVLADELITFEVTAEQNGGELPDGVAEKHAARARELGLCATNMPVELRVERIWEGTSEVQRAIIAGQMVKRGPAFLA